MLHSPIHVGGGAEPSYLAAGRGSAIGTRSVRVVPQRAEPDQPAPADVPLGIGISVTVFAAIHP